MMPSPGDHLLVALIALAYPLYFALDWYRRLRPNLVTDASDARRRFYRQSMVELWLLTAVILSWWLWSGRAAAAIGLGTPGGRGFWIGAAVVVALAAFLGQQALMVHRSAEARAQVRKQLRGSSALMLPRGDRERSDGQPRPRKG